MVHISKFTIPSENGSISTEAWLQQCFPTLASSDLQQIRQACQLAQLTGETIPTINGESCLRQGLAMAEVLKQLNVDSHTIAAGIIYSSALYTDLSDEDISEHLGAKVSKLISGTRQLNAIHSLRTNTRQQASISSTTDNLRKMLLAMVDDLRVVLIKLAERLCLMRNLTVFDQQHKQKWATETLELYAPLANRLGIGALKWQLEDYSFRYLDPDKYKEISKALKQRRLDREEFISDVIKNLQKKLTDNDIEHSDITGRAKHIYSIYGKMQRKKVDISEIYDALAVRILVDNIEDCYKTLSIVHGLWQHIPKEFDDYITTPKANGYRSIHTAVIGPNDKNFEVQIRTYQMHDEAELGVAAHWKYKEGVSQQTAYEQKIACLREVMAWEKEVTEQDEHSDEIHSQVFDDQVYVFTPGDDVIALPAHATPLDFAYHIHSDIGNKCRGAKVNGKLVPLTYQLKTGEKVEIQTAKNATPSRDWINPNLGYLITSRAKAKVQHWFRTLDYDDNLVDGRSIFEKECRRLNIKHIDIDKLSLKLNFKTGHDMLVALGRGDIRIGSVIHAAQELLHIEPEKAAQKPTIELTKPKSIIITSEIQIQGVDNLLTHIAGCCKPIPGDHVIGYITQGKGISIHRQDCGNITHITDDKQQRLIDVNWGTDSRRRYSVDLIIKGHNPDKLSRDLSGLLSNEKISLTGLNVQKSSRQDEAQLNLSVEINNVAALNQLTTKLQQLPNVTSVKRHR